MKYYEDYDENYDDEYYGEEYRDNMKYKRTGTTLMRKCMFTTSAAKIADITAAGVRKVKGAASSMQGTIMSVFRNHIGAISGKG